MGQGSLVKGGYSLAIRGAEGQVESVTRKGLMLWPEADGKFVLPCVNTVPHGSVVAPDPAEAQWGECGVIKIRSEGQICHGKGDVVQHKRAEGGSY